LVNKEKSDFDNIFQTYTNDEEFKIAKVIKEDKCSKAHQK